MVSFKLLMIEASNSDFQLKLLLGNDNVEKFTFISLSITKL